MPKPKQRKHGDLPDETKFGKRAKLQQESESISAITLVESTVSQKANIIGAFGAGTTTAGTGTTTTTTTTAGTAAFGGATTDAAGISTGTTTTTSATTTTTAPESSGGASSGDRIQWHSGWGSSSCHHPR